VPTVVQLSSGKTSTVRAAADVFLDSLGNPNYETAGRAEEILGVNIEDLDFAGRRCPVKAKGARSKARCRGQAREDYVRETVYGDAGIARLLPRLLTGRIRGPVSVTRRRPGPGKVVSPRDVCRDTGLARLSYGQARALLDEHTAARGPGTGWDLHEYRHSALTHLGEQGASLLMLMARSRHKKPENVRRCFKPSPEAISELTGLLAPGDARR
jgi:integrase